jgi:3',5'-cyclic AMP phosphodiesterase CpdA
MNRRSWIKGVIGGGVAAVGLRRGWADPGAARPLRVLYYTDVHAGSEGAKEAALELAADAMRAVEVDLVICGGDVINGGLVSTEAECGPKFQQYRRFLERLDHPVQHVIGNHDLAGAAPRDGEKPVEDPREMVRRELGIVEDYRTFDAGGYRFVVLDSVELTGGEAAYRGFVEPEQMAWLRGVVAATPPDQAFVLVTHIPFRTTFLQRKDGPGAGLPENLVVANANEVLAIFDGRNLPLVLQGHLHSNEVIDWAGRKFLMGGAVCGGWWRGPNLETGFGFGVLELGGGRVEWEYRGYGWPV